MAKILKNAQFYSEKWPRKTATKTWLFLLYFWFLLSQFHCPFPLVCPYFLLFHAILEPQNSPPSEVTGYNGIATQIHIRVHFLFVNNKFQFSNASTSTSNDRWGSGKKKEFKAKLFGPDIFGWGGGLPREGLGAKKFGMSFETQGNQTFGRDVPGFLPGYPSGIPKPPVKTRWLVTGDLVPSQGLPQ